MCWVICEGVPFCLATDQLLPANDPQALAYNYLHGGQDRLPPEVQLFSQTIFLLIAKETQIPVVMFVLVGAQMYLQMGNMNGIQRL